MQSAIHLPVQLTQLDYTNNTSSTVKKGLEKEKLVRFLSFQEGSDRKAIIYVYRVSLTALTTLER